MSVISHVRRLAILLVLPMAFAGFSAVGHSAEGASVPNVRADSVAGEWKAQGADPGWNGRFKLTLVLTQLGDSVYGTYQFDVDGDIAIPPADISGHMQGNTLELEDRADKFWLRVTSRGDHLDGRLAGSARKRATALPISFTRVVRRP